MIISGATWERIIRTVLIAALVNGFAAAFLWDGYVGYTRKNAEALVRTLGRDGHKPPAADPALTGDQARQLVNRINRGTDADSVIETLGKPAVEQGREVYYLGPGGYIRIVREANRAVSAEWVDGVHTETDLLIQRWLGWLLGVFGLIWIGQLIRVLTTRVTLSDQGLKLRGKPLIPFDTMTGLRVKTAGRVELSYTMSGRTWFVRLDDYVIREFASIISAICERKGFANPLSNPPAE